MEIAVAALYCVLVPKSVWDQVGELDESYQVGMFEDDDFSLRIRHAGYRIVASDDAFIHHFGNGSFAKLPSEDSLRIFEQNRKRFEDKWGVKWEKHKLRPGARAPFEELRHTPKEFLTASEAGMRRQGAPALRQLHPSVCRAKAGFNVQSNGQSALVVSCEQATPGTVIVFAGTMLTTAYGNQRLLSAFVPPELYSRPGHYPVYLLNDFGESNRLDFVIEAERSSAAAD
jgi:hypothetical protein